MKIQQKLSRSPKGVLGGPLYLRLRPEEMARVEQHAAADNRSRANFLRIVTLLGLDAYENETARLSDLSTQLTSSSHP
ncbi:hypothetical protein ACXX82_17255 [Glaciimonas sp. GNP009]